MSLFPKTITGRLGLGYAAMAAFMAATIAMAWVELQSLGDLSRHLTRELASREREARQWQALLGRDALTANSMLVTSDPDKLKPLAAEMKADTTRLQALHTEFAGRTAASEDTGRLKQSHERYLAATRDFMQALDSGSSDFARTEFNDKFLPSSREYQGLLEQLAQGQQANMDQSRDKAEAQSAAGFRLMLAVGISGLVIAVVLAWRLAVGIRRALTEAIRMANAVSDGDLAARSTVAVEGELAELFGAQQRMCERLQGTVSAILHSAEAVQRASSEIASGNSDLRARTEQQAGTLQETSSAMLLVAGAVQGNAQMADEASRLANAASQNAVERGEQMNQLVTTMREMADGSSRIAEITGVIDSIAFQTNILALNAAAEAARAGEQGRGFAVVADEVRTLARRSATAAQEIRSLLQGTVERTNAGARLMSAAGESIGTLVQNVQRVSSLLQEVAASIGVQSQDIGNIHQSIASLDNVTQQNAGMVEQSAAASSSLKDQADRLKEAVTVFKIA